MNNNVSAEKGQQITIFGISFPWIIVILGAILLFSNSIYTYTFGVLFKPIAEEFGWSRAIMSGAYTIRSILSAALTIIMGYWSDRYGPRKVLLPCFILFGICMMATAKVNNLWQFYLLYGAGIGIGSAGSFVCVASTIARWHSRKRGLALGVSALGVGLGSIIAPPITAKLIESIGWRNTTVVLGLLILVLGVSASVMFKNPSFKINHQSSNGIAVQRGPFDVWRLLPYYLKNHEFQLIIIMFMIVYTVGFMWLNHLVNYATDVGVSALTAAGMMSAMGISSTLGRLVMGTISDRIGTKADAATCWILMTLSLILMITKSIWLLWFAVVPFGIALGGTMPLVPAIMAERVTIEEIGIATGVGSMGANIGGILGPWLGGFMFDLSGNYQWALLLSSIVSIAALIIVLLLPTPKHNHV